MRTAGTSVLLALLALGSGCQVLRTDSRLNFDGPLDAQLRIDIPPVTPAGPLRPVAVAPFGPGPRIAVIDVDGLLLNTPFSGPGSVGENPVALFREKLEAAEADPAVSAILLRINSPGGGVAAVMTMRSELTRFQARKRVPVVACLLDVGCGGAYYLASAADRIVAGPGTVTGGVGVILNLFNLQDLMAQYNVIPQPIKAGANMDIGSSARPLGEEEKQLLQAMADEFHARLVADVRRSRPAANPDGGATFDGRIFTATQARLRGLVDQVGDLDDALDLAAKLATGGADTRPQVVLYRRPNDPAHSAYAVTANVPLQGAGILPNLPGLDRSKLPTFLSLWQPELTMEKLGGK
ncbi:MAG TPA: S49 family peptidase [Gemmataceae bacterium]|nr:S49 family peptidase [Gemmataceae bacterium]